MQPTPLLQKQLSSLQQLSPTPSLERIRVLPTDAGTVGAVVVNKVVVPRPRK